MQQLQQVIRQVTAGNAQVLVSSPSSGISSGSSGTALLTKTPQGQTVQARVIPVSQQGLKQTIQVSLLLLLLLLLLLFLFLFLFLFLLFRFQF